MQLLHLFHGSPQAYADAIPTPDCARPDHCPQCHARAPLIGHGVYHRTLVDVEFDGSIPVRRYLCQSCGRTVSLLPEFALPYLRFSITVIAQFLMARLQEEQTLVAGAEAAQPAMPYQRGQVWIRRFRRQAAAVCAALAGMAVPPAAPSFVIRALKMLRALGWIPAHRFLFADLRMHLLGWPAWLAPDGRVVTLPRAAPSG
jgi:hypothetical protein